MNSETTHRNNARAALIGLLAIILALLALFVGCTVTPKAFKDSTPSFDGGEMNSGLIGFYTNEQSVSFMVVTPHFRERFDALAPVYGTNFLPAVKPGEGFSPFTNGTYLLNLEGLYKFSVMNRKRKAH